MIQNKNGLIKLLVVICIIFFSMFVLYKGKKYLFDYTNSVKQKNTINQIKDNEVIKPNTNSSFLTEGLNKNIDQDKKYDYLMYEMANELPLRAYLEVPFVTQAPLETEDNWAIHDESCEEAAIYQVIAYQKGIKKIDRIEADRIFKNMIDWQINNFGNHHDIYADEAKKFILGYFDNIENKRVIIVKDANIQDIKKFIAAGIPVIAPATAKLLKNPYYHHPGYHMLTIIGYTEDRLITNDVGTKRGKDFSYDNQIFMNAMKDATGFIVVILPD